MEDQIVCVSPSGDICGEGAVWDPGDEVLYWADINRYLLHRYSLHRHTAETWCFNEPVVSVNRTSESGTLLLVLAERIVLWTASEHPRTTTIHRLCNSPGMRFNDAKVDPCGSLWVGTMRNNVGPDGENLEVEFSEGVLYRLDPDGTVTEWMHGIGISNTVAWSPDGATFYFGDTIADTIYAFDFDAETRAVANRRPFFSGTELGLPDGSAMDAEGCLWNTRPFAGCVVRILPNGDVDRVVQLPISKPTTCAFGGTDLRTLFLTSARSAERLSGSLFALQTGVPGVPVKDFHLDPSERTSI